MANPLITTRPISCSLEEACDSLTRESSTVALWENILIEHMVRPNKELTLNSQQPVDDTLKKVDLMVRYYNEKDVATALFLIEAKRTKQTSYNIEQLENQLHDYTSFLFSAAGIAHNQLVVYGGVVYGPRIRIYRISKMTQPSKPIYVDMTPIWGGELYDQASYRDVRKSSDAHEVLNAFKEIASLANYALGTTATGTASIPSLNHASAPTLPSKFSASHHDQPSSSKPHLIPTAQNRVSLRKAIEKTGRAYYIYEASGSQSKPITEWVEGSSWTQVSPSGSSKYWVNSTKGI